MISVVIPTLNAAEGLGVTLSALVPAAVNNLVREVVVADGGSTDATLAVVEDAGARLVQAGPGRMGQVAAGCAAAKGPWLLILDPGVRLGPEWEAAARDHMEHHAGEAGYFRFALDDHRAAARLREAAAALFGGRTPAQGLLVTKFLYDQAGERGLKGRLRPLAARAFGPV